jgi:hypothetical protein
MKEYLEPRLKCNILHIAGEIEVSKPRMFPEVRVRETKKNSKWTRSAQTVLITLRMFHTNLLLLQFCKFSECAKKSSSLLLLNYIIPS